MPSAMAAPPRKRTTFAASAGGASTGDGTGTGSVLCRPSAALAVITTTAATHAAIQFHIQQSAVSSQHFHAIRRLCSFVGRGATGAERTGASLDCQRTTATPAKTSSAAVAIRMSNGSPTSVTPSATAMIGLMYAYSDTNETDRWRNA